MSIANRIWSSLSLINKYSKENIYIFIAYCVLCCCIVQLAPETPACMSSTIDSPIDGIFTLSYYGRDDFFLYCIFRIYWLFTNHVYICMVAGYFVWYCCRRHLLYLLPRILNCQLFTSKCIHIKTWINVHFLSKCGGMRKEPRENKMHEEKHWKWCCRKFLSPFFYFKIVLFNIYSLF